MPRNRRSVRRAVGALALLAVLAAWATPALCRRGPRVDRAPRKRVVVLVGLPGSGKTTISRALARRMGAARHTCGDVIRGWVRHQGLPYTPHNDRLASRHFARKPGEIARQLGARIAASKRPLHIVDGVRSPADMKVLRQSFDVRVVALKLPRKLRFQRMLARGRFAGENRDYLVKRDRREIGLGVLHVLRRPFVRLDTSGPLSQVPSQAARLAEALQKSW